MAQDLADSYVRSGYTSQHSQWSTLMSKVRRSRVAQSKRLARFMHRGQRPVGGELTKNTIALLSRLRRRVYN